MPVTHDRLARLRDFGLSEYAARAYLALLDLGIAEARDVSSLSKVPQAKIYHVLEQLHEKGLVVVLPEFPKKYAPVPFQEYLDRLYEEHRRAASTIESERDELAELYRVVGATEVADRGFFTVLRGRRNVLARVEEMLSRATRDLLVVGTPGSAARLSKLVTDLERAKARGVGLRFLVPLEPDTIEGFGRLRPLAQLRGRAYEVGEQGAKVCIVLCDGHAAFVIHFVPDDASFVAGKDIGVYTDHEAVVAALQALVEPQWSRAAPFEAHEAGGRPLRPEELGIAPFFDSADEGVIVTEADGAVVLWNARAARLLDREAWEGVRLEDVIEGSARVRRADGSHLDADVSQRAFEAAGRRLRLVLVREATRGPMGPDDEGETYRRAFLDAPAGMGVLDAEGRFVRVNPAFCRLLGREEKEILGVPEAVFARPDEAAALALRRLLSGQTQGASLARRYVRPDGSVVATQLTASLLRDADGAPWRIVAQAQPARE